MIRLRSPRIFARDERGAALVEFAIILPMMLLFLALSVEGARTFWAYQATISGVRDAARFLSRVVDVDICATGGSVSQWDGRLLTIVRDARDGGTVFPSGVTVRSVGATLACESGFRGGAAGVATVTAKLDIDYPFSGVFTLIGMDLTSVATQVRDQARVIGL
mgnify:CR=1 FL=1